jgi:nicotinamidase-related amidase
MPLTCAPIRLPGEETVVKTRFSAFHATALRADLAARGVTRLVLAGVQTPNCIRATAYDALALDVPTVVVLSDATAAATPFVQQANLYDLRVAGCDVFSVAEWAQSMGLEEESDAAAGGAA